MNRAWDHFHQKDAPSAPLIPQTLVAVITAAVVAAMGEDAAEYRVASIRKVDPVSTPGNIWSQAGRLERINSRQRFFERIGK